jgi:hypothetical protein
MKGYLYISYCPKGSLKEHKLYQCLRELRKERGIGISPEVLKRTRVGRWTSPDRSGCYVIDLTTDFVDPDTTHAAHATPLLKQLMREMKLDELGI